MTTDNSWEERLEEVIRPLGMKGTLFLVPDINSSCELWVIQRREDTIKAFLAKEIEAAEQRGRDMAVDYIDRAFVEVIQPEDIESTTFQIHRLELSEILKEAARSLPDQHE